MKKLSLENLKITSFVTSMNALEAKNVKGGCTILDLDCDKSSIHHACKLKGSEILCPPNYTRNVIECVTDQ